MKVNNNAPKGEASHKAKLTEKQAIEIKARVKAGEHYKDLAKEFGVSPSAIQNIKRGDSWGHLK